VKPKTTITPPQAGFQIPNSNTWQKSKSRIMKHNTHRTVHFREVHQFRQQWLWVLLLLTLFSLVIIFGYGMIRQLVFGQTWGDRPLSDSALAITGTIMILFVGSITYLFYALKLITEVRENGLYIQFFPLSQKIIPFDIIKRYEARTYRPIREYSGWGIKYGRREKAYNVSGNSGVQLEFFKENVCLSVHRNQKSSQTQLT
jgi:hypothetical protein